MSGNDERPPGIPEGADSNAQDSSGDKMEDFWKRFSPDLRVVFDAKSHTQLRTRLQKLSDDDKREFWRVRRELSVICPDHSIFELLEENRRSGPGNLRPVFWERHPLLLQIRAAAHARLVSPDAVLGGLLARAAAAVSPDLPVDTGVDDATSLNLLVATIGSPGTSKSQAEKLADRLLPLSDFPVRLGSVGSGEGIAEMFMGERPTGELLRNGRPATERGQVRWNAYMHADEGEVLTKLGERSSSTLGTTLRSAFTGGPLGQANATKERTRDVRGYALGLVAAFQPETARPLLDEEPQGTPQRFLYLSALDPTVPSAGGVQEALWDTAVATPTPSSGPLSEALTKNVTTASSLSFPRPGVAFPAAVTQQVRHERQQCHRPDTEPRDPMDAHRTLLQLKVAVLLTVLLEGLHGERVVIGRRYWGLADDVVAVSCAVRDELLRAKAVAERARVESATLNYVDRRVRADHAVRGQGVVRVAKRIRKQATQANNEGVPLAGRQGLRMRFNRDDRVLFDEGLEYAMRARWVVVTEDGRAVPVVEP